MFRPFCSTFSSTLYTSHLVDRLLELLESAAIAQRPLEDVQAVIGRQPLRERVRGLNADGRVSHHDAAIAASQHGTSASLGAEQAHIGREPHVDERIHAAAAQVFVQHVGVEHEGLVPDR